VVAGKEIYDTFMAAGGPDYMLEFAHGYTYSAHPVACAAGIAALDVLVKEDMINRVKAWPRISSRRCTASRAANT
jgi:beta-alanine--pyruvate transaminase